METYNIVPLLKTLNDRPDIFICGPSYDNNKLRVYAYGGILCELPTNPQARIELLEKNYQKYLQTELPLFDVLDGLQSEKEKEKFLRDHLDDLLLCMKERFTSKSGDCEERSQQTAISRLHTSFSQHNGTVVCDFQSSIPKKWLPDGMKRPAFDMVTFSMDETGHGVFTLVELKCNGASCKGDRGLEKHAKDMLACVQSPLTSHFYKKELLRRLGYMHKYGLLQNGPAELEHLSSRHLEYISLRAAFLFTFGAGLESRGSVVSLCEKFIPDNNMNDFFYCCAENPQAVDLSRMESWNTFSSNQ